VLTISHWESNFLLRSRLGLSLIDPSEDLPSPIPRNTEKPSPRLALTYSHELRTFGALLSVQSRHNLVSRMQRLTIVRSKPKQRAVARFSLRLPVIFEWSDGTDHVEGGFTKEIARDAAFILSDRCPPVGSEVRMKVLFPSPAQPGPLCLECAGRVARLSDVLGTKAYSFRVCLTKLRFRTIETLDTVYCGRGLHRTPREFPGSLFALTYLPRIAALASNHE